MFQIETKKNHELSISVQYVSAIQAFNVRTLVQVDNETEPARNRSPLAFSEVYLGQVMVDDFRRNARSELGTRTATLHKAGIEKLRRSWVYRA